MEALGSRMPTTGTILVLTGITCREDVPRYPHQPTPIVPSIAEIEPQKENERQPAKERLPTVTSPLGALFLSIGPTGQNATWADNP